MNNKKSLKEEIIKDASKYNLAHYGSQLINFITALAMRRFLGPYLMGTWSMLKVVLTYCTYGLLGVNRAALYKVPYYVGRKDREAANEIRNSAFGFNVVASVVTGFLLLAIFGCLLRKRFPPDFTDGIYVISFFIILQRVYLFYFLMLKAAKNFSVVSRSIIFDAVLNLVLVLLLVKKFQLQGMYLTVVLLAFANTVFMHAQVRYKISFSFDKARIKELLGFGLPLAVIAFLTLVLKTIDRVMIAKMLGFTYVGYYSVGIMAKSYSTGAVNIFANVTLPRMMESFGREESAEKSQKFITKPTLAVAFLLSPFLGGVFLVAPPFVRLVLPQYVSGIPVLQILLLDVFFLSCVFIAQQFLVAQNKQLQIVPVMIAIIIMNVLLNYILIKRGFGIYGVAAGTAIASFANFMMLEFYALRHFKSMKNTFIFLVKVILPLLYTGFCVLLMDHYFRISNIYFNLGLKVLALGVVSVPLLFFVEKDMGIVSICWKIFKDKFGGFSWGR